jgi:hypothetical protein
LRRSSRGRARFGHVRLSGAEAPGMASISERGEKELEGRNGGKDVSSWIK